MFMWARLREEFFLKRDKKNFKFFGRRRAHKKQYI